MIIQANKTTPDGWVKTSVSIFVDDQGYLSAAAGGVTYDFPEQERDKLLKYLFSKYNT